MSHQPISKDPMYEREGCFLRAKAHVLDIGTLLDLHGVAVRTGHHCAQLILRQFGIKATTRASFGLYNTMEDVEYFVRALKEVLKSLNG